MAGDEDRWLSLGAVGKPHGLRGAFFVSGRSDPIPKSVKSVRLGDDASTARVCEVITAALAADRPVMALREFGDRTAIEGIRGTKIWAPRGDFAVDDDSEYLWSDVTGADVYDSTGARMGRIVDMANYGASDIAVIQNDAGEKVEIPFVDVYVDMSFRGPVERIDLRVESQVFAEFWIKP